jgi:hypothetical protein
MRMLAFITSLLIILPVSSLAGQDSVPHLISDDPSVPGLQTLALEEMWRAGGEDDEVFFGRIVEVKRGPDGSIYILDNQICQVMVFSAEGEHLRDLSRQGDGPGELRQPMGLIFPTDETVGVGMGFPGKLVTMKLDGTPVQSFFPIGAPADGNIGVMIGIQYRDGFMVASGGSLVFGGPDESHTKRFLSVCNADCSERQNILEKPVPLDPNGQRYVESRHYYPDFRWILGPSGLVYAADQRDAYEISVYDKTGSLVKVFGRKFKARKRTGEDKEEVRPLIDVTGNPDIDITAEDHDECISRVLFNDDDQTFWVQSPHSEEGHSEDILEAWDVFSLDGKYLKQVGIPLGNEMEDGACYLVGDNQLIIVKGSNSPFRGDDEEEEDLEIEPLEVICYAIR